LDFLWDSFQWAFGPQWRWSVPIALWLFLFFVSPWGRSLAGNDADRKRWIGFLTQDRGKRRYQRVMTRLLDAVDTRLSGPEIEAEKSDRAKAWSLGLLDLMMLLGVAYPILSFVAQWIAGSPLRFGGVELVERGSSDGRLFAGVLFACAGGLFLWYRMPPQRWWFPLIIGAAIVVGRFLFSPPDFFSQEISYALVFTLAFALGSGGTRNGGALAVALAGIFAFPVAGFFAIVSVLLFDRIESRIPTPMPRLVWLGLLLVTYSAVVLWFWLPEGRNPAAYLMIFLGLFPIFNAIADFASVGLTRILLRRGLDGLTWREAIVDAIGGIVIFAALGMAAITWIHLVRPPDGQQLLNLTGLFRDLEDNPQDMWWLAFMLGSTLLPTALHAGIGVFTLLLSYPEALRTWVVTQLDEGGKGSHQAAWLGGGALTAMLLASIWIPFLIGHAAFTANHGWLIKKIIGFFEGYARWIGAI
jgi:hypothetical protein